MGDTDVESDETFFVNLTGASPTPRSPTPRARARSQRRPWPAQLSINDVTVTEGNSGTTNATFTVTLDGAATGTVTVDYATANGTATAPSDYTATSGTLTFAPGEHHPAITVRSWATPPSRPTRPSS